MWKLKKFHTRNLQLAIHLLIWTLSNKIKVITYFIYNGSISDINNSIASTWGFGGPPKTSSSLKNWFNIMGNEPIISLCKWITVRISRWLKKERERKCVRIITNDGVSFLFLRIITSGFFKVRRKLQGSQENLNYWLWLAYLALSIHLFPTSLCLFAGGVNKTHKSCGL